MLATDALAQLLSRRDLAPDQAEALMEQFVEGGLPDGLVGGLLVAVQAKGATGAELAAFARVMRRHAKPLAHGMSGLLDTCGTGGGKTTFNLSTAAALVAAAAGAKVAKHGNRGVTSPWGSADVLEHLGVDITSDEGHQVACLREAGVTFLFAQAHHPAMRHVGPVRKSLGVRTMFNLLGPLANPAGASRQLIGVYDQRFVVPVAEALVHLGTEQAMVVYAEEGMDEVSACGATRVAVVDHGHIRITRLKPEDFGIDRLPASALDPGPDLAANAAILREAISDADSPRFLALLPNAAVALFIAGVASDFADAAQKVREAVASGRALATLEKLAELSQSKGATA